MDVFYINRDIDEDRNHSIVEQLRQYPKNVIYQFKRVSAVDVGCWRDNWTPKANIDRLIANNPKIRWYLMIFMSHLKALTTFYRTSSSRYAVILEDDSDIIWNKISWNRLIEAVEQRYREWQVIKLYRNFHREYNENEGPVTPYLKARRNPGAVGYLVNRCALRNQMSKIKQLGFSHPNFDTIHLESMIDQFEQPVMDTERLIFTWLFDPNLVLQSNVPVVGHTYHFKSSKITPDQSTGFNRARQLNAAYFRYLSHLDRIPCYLKSLKLELFTAEQGKILSRKRGHAAPLEPPAFKKPEKRKPVKIVDKSQSTLQKTKTICKVRPAHQQNSNLRKGRLHNSSATPLLILKKSTKPVS